MSEYDDQLTIRQQRSALANMEQTINDLRRELAAATERERELRDVLRSLEWIEGEYGAKSCYNCCRQEWQGHTEPCLVAAALAAAQQEGAK